MLSTCWSLGSVGNIRSRFAGSGTSTLRGALFAWNLILSARSDLDFFFIYLEDRQTLLASSFFISSLVGTDVFYFTVRSDWGSGTGNFPTRSDRLAHVDCLRWGGSNSMFFSLYTPPCSSKPKNKSSACWVRGSWGSDLGSDWSSWIFSGVDRRFYTEENEISFAKSKSDISECSSSQTGSVATLSKVLKDWASNSGRLEILGSM